MPKIVTTEPLPLSDILTRIDSFIEHNEMVTIFPENFFTSIRHHLTLKIDQMPNLSNNSCILCGKDHGGLQCPNLINC